MLRRAGSVVYMCVVLELGVGLPPCLAPTLLARAAPTCRPAFLALPLCLPISAWLCCVQKAVETCLLLSSCCALALLTLGAAQIAVQRA